MICEHLTINSIVSLYIPVWCLMVFLVLVLQCAPFHILGSVKAENKIRNGGHRWHVLIEGDKKSFGDFT